MSRTSIIFDLDYGAPQGDAADFGLGDGVTADEVIAALRGDRRYLSREQAIADWNLADDPDITVTVRTTEDDGTVTLTEAVWSSETDWQERGR